MRRTLHTHVNILLLPPPDTVHSSLAWFELTTNRSPNKPHAVNREIWDPSHMDTGRAPVIYVQTYCALWVEAKDNRSCNNRDWKWFNRSGRCRSVLHVVTVGAKVGSFINRLTKIHLSRKEEEIIEYFTEGSKIALTLAAPTWKKICVNSFLLFACSGEWVARVTARCDILVAPGEWALLIVEPCIASV